ncbi:MAG: repeat-containing protein [Pseudobdellovibrio sp.]|nr:repeat-containing protein [Pseudobdellovibrio sp.]
MLFLPLVLAYPIPMRIKNILIASLLVQSPFQSAFANPTEEIISNYTSKLKSSGGSFQSGYLNNHRAKQVDYCLIDDLKISNIENGLFVEIKKNISELNFAELTKKNFDNFGGVNKIASKPSRDIESISEFEWNKGKGNGSIVHRLKNYASVEFSELKVTDYLINPNNKSSSGDFNQAVVKVRLDVRGKDKQSHLMQDRLNLSLNLKLDGANWKIENIEGLKGLSLVQNGMPSFEDVTQTSGLDKVSVHLRTEALRRGGYAMAVTDYNNDGIQDLFVGHRENAEMFVGSKDGTFKKIETPLDHERYSKTAVFADFNNTGKRDVVINRFLTTDANGNKIENKQLPLQVNYYKNVDGKLVEQPNQFGDPSIFKKPMPSAVADYNGDGLLDIYIGYPGLQDFSQFGELPKNLLRYQGLYFNNGKGGFTDNTQSLKTLKDSANGQVYDAHLFPHSSLAIDLNQDHKMDLVVLDDRGNLSPAFVNQGNGTFIESADKIGVSNWGYAMGISSGDINNDGLVDVAMTNVNFNAIDRINRACKKHRGLPAFQWDNDGLRMFEAKAKGKMKFSEIPAEILEDTGESLGGLTFIDYNNDGHLDIYVVNGLWSGTPNGQNFGSFFASSLRVSKAPPLYSMSSRNDLRFMDVLQTFGGKIEDYREVSSIIPGNEKPSLGGFQRNRLYRNNGDGTFTDVAYLEGVDSIADGYIAGKMDYNNDGVMDLVLRNADPGTEQNKFPSVQLFKNNRKDQKKSVVLTFEGTKQNKEGIGLFVKAHAKGWQQVSHLEGNSGSMQQQRLIQFGLGDHKQIDKLEIFWPSGMKQVITNVGPGQRHIVEPNAGNMIGAN